MSRWRIVAVIAPGALASLAVLFIDPIPQDPNYHNFADQRVFFAIPHFGDVITNIGFMLAGSIGLARLLSPGRLSDAFETDRERRAWIVFFLGTLLTGLGSGWYHLQPDNARLFWDRLPMTLTFMALVSVMVSERIDARVGAALLGPLVLAGLSSVAWWDYTEQQGRGDLRWYGLVQFYPMVASVLMLLLFRSRYTRDYLYWVVFCAYAAAKIAEHFDVEIYHLSGWLSGHNLKHVLAALGAWPLLIMLRRRSVVA
ncbi:MAG: ceramidase domain-containing protein [Gammaproteobacteria bacterium]